MNVSIDDLRLRAKPLPLFKPGLRDSIRRGVKTQTRRVCNPQPTESEYQHDFFSWPTKQGFASGLGQHFVESNAKYQPGDIVYLREPLRRMTIHQYAEYTEGNVDAIMHLPWRWKRDYLTQMSMPKQAARFFYRITDVRCERLQEIDNNDALAEGTPDIRNLENGYDMRDCFAVLWDHINSERGYSWESNPWVFVYEWEPISAQGAA